MSAAAVVVAGPTAAGKSALALEIAEALGGDVVNADSLQLYRDLEILTARPGADARARAPHRLYGVLDARDRCSAGRWRDMALAEIRRSAGRGRLPVLVGGSGLYLGALLHGLHPVPAVPPAIREGLVRRLAAQGARALHAELSARDPETAAALAPGDGQRVLRALEVLDHTGRGLAGWRAEGTREAPAGVRFFILLVLPPRQDLYAACDRRTAAMLAGGAVPEVARLARRAPGDDCPPWRALGARPIRRYLRGEWPRADMAERIRRDTRRYAKRQATWFRRQMDADAALDSAGAGAPLAAIRRFLLTRR